MALRSQPRVLTGPPVQLTSGLTLHQCVSDLRAGIRREANPARESAPRPQMASSGGYRAVSSPRVGVSRWVTHFDGRSATGGDVAALAGGRPGSFSFNRASSTSILQATVIQRSPPEWR